MKSLATCSLLIALALQACAARQAEAPEPQPPQEAAAPPAAPAAAPALPPSNTSYAVRVVRVATSNDEETARAAVQDAIAPESLQRALQELQLNPGLVHAVSATTNEVDSRNAIDIEIIVDLSKGDGRSPKVAREVADAVVSGIRQRLKEHAQGSLTEHLRRIEEERARAQEANTRSRQQLQEVRTKIRQATGRSDTSSERLRDEMSRLEDARDEIQLQLETRAARVRALSENIAKVAAQVEQKVQNDPVSAELEKIVRAREQKVENLKQGLEKGTVSRNQYEEAVAEAAEARARLLDRRAHAADAAGADTVDDWNRELMKLAVDSAELQARLDGLNQRVERYHKVSEELDQLDSLASVRENSEEMLRETREQLRELQRRLASVRAPKSVVVISQDKSGSAPPANREDQAESSQQE